MHTLQVKPGNLNMHGVRCRRDVDDTLVNTCQIAYKISQFSLGNSSKFKPHEDAVNVKNNIFRDNLCIIRTNPVIICKFKCGHFYFM